MSEDKPIYVVLFGHTGTQLGTLNVDQHELTNLKIGIRDGNTLITIWVEPGTRNYDYRTIPSRAVASMTVLGDREGDT